MRPSEFPYAALNDDDLAGRARAALVAIRADLHQTAAATRSIGSRLLELQAGFDPEVFAAWLQDELLWTPALAEAFIQAARELDGPGGLRVCRPWTATDLADALLLPQSLIAQQLDKARDLLSAYRKIFRGDAAYEGLLSPRKPSVRPVRYRARGRRLRRENENSAE